MSIHIAELASHHATIAARLHIAGQPGTFLTTLGPTVLTVLYQALPQSAAGFGFAAMSTADTGLRDRSPVDPSPVGFIAATTSTSRLFLSLGTRHLHQFVPPLLMRFVQQPKLFYLSLQTLLYPFQQRHHGDNFNTGSGPAGDNSGDKWHNSGKDAELLAIMVDPVIRSQGIGGKLLQQLVSECRNRQLTALTVTVDAQNQGAQRFYRRHGFVEDRHFQLYGRPMYGFIRRI